VSLPRRSIAVGVSSTMVAVSAAAVGTSSIGVTVTTTAAVEVWPLPSVTVYENVSGPL
jgi:hypothetical protein